MAEEESTGSVIKEVLEAVSGGRRDLKIAGVQLKIVGEDLSVSEEFKQPLELSFSCQGPACVICFHDGARRVFEATVREVGNAYQAGSTTVLLRVSQGSAIVTTLTQNDTTQLLNHLQSHVAGGEKRLGKQSVFTLRTEEASSKQYFQFYGYLSQQQNMMQDYIRTSTYQSAMLQNVVDFKDKVVLDVGAGTGILSFFAIQAGARKVYAVEASSMAVHCAKLVSANGLSDKVTVIAGKVEEVDIPEQIDMIISEPMGYMLYNERMIESYLHAKKWLKPDGNMFPSKGVLYVAPFTDEALYIEQYNKATFWTQTSFHGVNLTSLSSTALEEYFRQPVLDMFDVRMVMAKPVAHTTDFLTTNETDLHKISIPLTFTLWSTGIMHGLAFWFDVAFCGSQETVWLSTGPTHPLTHWYQIRCLLPRPVLVNSGQVINGNITLTANQRQSYDVEIVLKVVGTDIQLSSSYDLKNPSFRYMGAPGMVPGTQHTNPTEAYFENLIPQQSGGHNSATPQSMVGGATKTDNPNLVNGGSMLQQTSPMDPILPYQQIPMPVPPHVVPMSQTFTSAASGSSNVVGSPNQLMYAMTSSNGGGVMYKYQQLHPVSQPATSSGMYPSPQYTVPNYTQQQMNNYSPS